MPKVKKIVLAGLLLSALVLSRLVSIQTEFLRTGIGYIPTILCGILLGPWWCSAVAALGDVVGMMLFPKGVFFPGFTFSAFLAGWIYGFFLHNTKNNKQFLIRLIIACVLVSVIVNIGFNSLWLYIITKKAAVAFVPARIIANFIKLPLKIGAIFVLKIFLDPLMKRFLFDNKVPDIQLAANEEPAAKTDTHL